MGLNRWMPCSITVLTVMLMGPALAAPVSDAGRLTDLSLEELSNLTITSVSKHAERLSDAPTAVFVITGDDIRRSGVTSLPEALRLAPNLQVARASVSGWAISARGFNSPSANKLLVLIDGRSVYSPLFSGVFWDVQDVMLEDVERIEVISGPGGTLWGVNAVNGVINVITRSAGQTQGLLLSGGAGNQEAQAGLRQGGALGPDGHYRVYARQSQRSHTELADGSAVNDGSHTTQLGFRADWARRFNKLTVQGDVYRGKREQPLPGTLSLQGFELALDTVSVSGGNLIVRGEHALADDASISAQFSYDHTERTVPPTFSDQVDIFDLQVQHAWRPSPAQSLVWGAQYRYAMDEVGNSAYFAFLPSRVNQAWASLFVQDEITLTPALRLTLGSRIERNAYTGSEFLPNLRLAWKPDPTRLLWGAASRTVRAPSRLDRDIFAPGVAPFLLNGGPDFQSEVAKVYELGYRAQPTADTSYSVSVFHSDYDRLHTLELAPSRTTVFFGNGMQGTVRGLEIWGTLQASSRWRLRGGFTRLWQDLNYKPGSIDAADSLAVTQGSNPNRQWMLRSSLDLPRQTELELITRYVSDLALPSVPSYLAVDVRLAWQPTASTELSITGNNLLGPRHGEFTPVATRTAFSRSVYFQFVSRF